MTISISIYRARTLARHIREASHYYDGTALTQRDRGRAALLRREAKHLERDIERAIERDIERAIEQFISQE